MATYEKMVLLSEAEYLNLKNFKYLPHEVDDESGYDDYGDDDGDDGDDGGDESGYEKYVTEDEDEDPGRWRRASTEDSGRQTPEERHIETPSEDSSRLRWVQRQQESESRHSTPAHHSRHTTPIASPGGSISDDENRRRVEGVRTQLMAAVGAIKESLPAPPPLEVIEGLRPDEVREMEQVERLSILRRDTPEDWRHKVVQIMNRRPRSKDIYQ